MKTNLNMSRYLTLLLGLALTLWGPGLRAQQSPNTVKYQVTYNTATQTYTAWVVPDYSTPNSNGYNTGASELVSTAQFTLKVPVGFVISTITDATSGQVWDKAPPKLGPGLSLTAVNGTVFTQDYSPATLDPAYAYYVIGKSPTESNLGAFVAGTPVALFTFKGNGCFGPIQPMAPSDAFIQAALDAYSFNVPNSFYSASGQPQGGNQVPLEQFVNITGPAANCSQLPIANPDAVTGSPGVATTIPVLSNDTNNGSPATTTNVTVSVSTPPTAGTATVNPDGTISYTPPPGYSGPPISFTYTICDKTVPTACSSASITVTVTPTCLTIVPTLSASAKSNICPVTTVDLSTITASNAPAGYTLGWFSGTPATAANQLGSSTVAVAGTYYAAFYNAATACYGPTTPVTATINACCVVGVTPPTLIKN